MFEAIFSTTRAVEQQANFDVPHLLNFCSPADVDVCFMSTARGPQWSNFDIEDVDEDVVVNGGTAGFRPNLESDEPSRRHKCDGSLDDSDGSQDSAPSTSSFILLEPSSPSELYQKIHPAKVRWFYKQENDKKWTAFIGYDSMRLEICYRLSLGDDAESYESLLEDLTDHEREALYRKDKLVVRGGLYEVDFDKRLCSSIFWHGEQSVITRGTWFYDGSGQPIDDPFAETIEEAHFTTFQNRNVSEFSQTSSRRIDALHTVSFPDFRVEWYSPAEVYLYSEAKSSKIMRSVSERLGFQKSGYKLQRGYYCPASFEDKQPDISHLVFVVHGIGQKIDTEKVIRNCRSLRKCANWIKEKYFSHLNDSNERSEFFPVEWRSSLKLDGDTVESITPHRVRGLRDFLNCSAMDVLYYTSPLYCTELICGLRERMNQLYTKFCQRNPYFEKVGGKVSIVAHSLGAVISYDIITNWNPVNLYESCVPNHLDSVGDSSSDIADLVHKLIKSRKEVCELERQLRSSLDLSGGLLPRNGLKFVIENFFCLGSPLAVFLALRGVRPQGRAIRDFILPTSLVRRFFNIFHPADPVAYRLEPLILKHYSTILPLYIHNYWTAVKIPYELMKVEYLTQENQDVRGHSPIGDEGPDSAGASPNKSARSGSDSRWSAYWPSFMKRLSTPAIVLQSQPSVVPMKMLQDYDAECEEPTSCPQLEEDFSDCRDCEGANVPPPATGQISGCDSPKTPEVFELDYRLDYVLREGNLESSYISAVTSHTAYWSSYDVAYFVLSYLHSDCAVPLANRL